jgi:hypothetical protein
MHAPDRVLAERDEDHGLRPLRRDPTRRSFCRRAVVMDSRLQPRTGVEIALGINKSNRCERVGDVRGADA